MRSSSMARSMLLRTSTDTSVWYWVPALGSTGKMRPLAVALAEPVPQAPPAAVAGGDVAGGVVVPVPDWVATVADVVSVCASAVVGVGGCGPGVAAWTAA